MLPLLAIPEYYAQAKQGYARGGMPVAFVDRVRDYYDVLLAHERPHQPRLRLIAGSPIPEPATTFDAGATKPQGTGAAAAAAGMVPADFHGQ